MVIHVHTAEEKSVTAHADDCPDGLHKCVTVRVGTEDTKLDVVSARSLIVGLEAIVIEVENRNEEIKGDS